MSPHNSEESADRQPSKSGQGSWGEQNDWRHCQTSLSGPGPRTSTVRAKFQTEPSAFSARAQPAEATNCDLVL
ncbi:hypothetical protein H9L39_09005 [Fusarium oxysporum f. sp. albedinis]|nr:hypothetical protein H9L39_09005 [Fusarium oxysporum f. sp. albedinis]